MQLKKIKKGKDGQYRYGRRKVVERGSVGGRVIWGYKSDDRLVVEVAKKP